MVPGTLDDLPRPRNDRPLRSLHACICHPDSSAQADWSGSSGNCRDIGNDLDTGQQKYRKPPSTNDLTLWAIGTLNLD